MIGRIIAAVLSGVAGALGIGGGGILIIYLTLFETMPQIEAQGVNLLFFLPCGLIAAIIHSVKKRIEWKTALWIIFGGAPGAMAGFLLGNFMGNVLLGKTFAILLILLGIKSLFATKQKASPSK